MNRIRKVTLKAKEEGRKLLIPYLVAGDPNLTITVDLMNELVKDGADIIELGIPFSDPSSDGPVIQRGVERALARGTTLEEILQVVSRFRCGNSVTPIVLMGYLNPIEIMGYEFFAQLSSEVGVDGVLVVDMPPAESANLKHLLQEASIEMIYLVAPTTSHVRANTIARYSSGYLYYVSLKGVTGAALTDLESVASSIKILRELTDLPIVIGFGIKDADSAREMSELAEGVVIGSSLVEEIAKLAGKEQISNTEITATTELIRESRKAIDN